MQDDLVRVIDRNLVLQVYIEPRVHQRVLSQTCVLVDTQHFAVGAHNDLVTVRVNVTLAQRHRLSQHVEASAKQVNIEHFVVLDQTENPLVVVTRFLRAVGDDNALGGARFDYAFRH